MNLKKIIRRNDDSKLIKSESKERNTIQRSGMESMIETSTKLNLLNSSKNKVEFRNKL